MQSYLDPRSIDINAKDKNGETSLTRAVFLNNLKEVKWLIANRANLDSQNKDGYTALMFACFLGYFNITSTLMEAKANLDIQDYSEKCTALTFALEYKRLDCAKSLIEANANLKIPKKNLPINIEIKYYRETLIPMLLTRGVNGDHDALQKVFEFHKKPELLPGFSKELLRNTLFGYLENDRQTLSQLARHPQFKDFAEYKKLTKP